MGFSKKAVIAAAVYQDVNPSGKHSDHILPRLSSDQLAKEFQFNKQERLQFRQETA
jgi:hypothetical protein